jgi:hypothetical protein
MISVTSSSLPAERMDRRAALALRAARARWCLGAAAATLLTGCQGLDMNPANMAQVRVIAASPDAGSMDFYAGQTALAYSVDFGTASTYVPLAAGNMRLSATTANTTQMLVASNTALGPGRQYTAVVTNVAASLQETIYADQTTPAPAGDVAVRVIDAATRAGGVDLYMVPAGGRLTATAAMRSGLGFGASTGYMLAPAGTYSLVAVPAGTAPTNQAQTLMIAPQTSYAAGAARTVVLVDRVTDREADPQADRQSPPPPGVDEIVTSDYDPSSPDVK